MHNSALDKIMMNYTEFTCLILLLGVVYCQVNETTKTVTTIPLIQVAQSDQCPPWFFYNATSKVCECYSSPSTDNIVKCIENGALLRYGYCMTYEEGEGFYVGLCDYFNLDKYNRSTTNNYISLPNNVSELNDYMCGPLNRKGIMCGQCIDGYGQSVTSIGHTCSNCVNTWYGVPLYLFIEFVPITVFYFIILFFRINMTSAPMLTFVFYCQIGVSTLLILSNRYLFSGTITYCFLNILITFYGIWNLDFFRYIIPPFCVSPHLKGIHITFMYNISAFYPLCLIAISWIFILLPSKNRTLTLWLQILKKWLSKYTKVKWNANNTMIDVFATIFLLCYAKLVFTCLRVLSYRVVIKVTNTSIYETFYVRSDPTVVFFSREHLPFAIISIAIFLVVLLPTPLLLALFPVRAFRSLLFRYKFASRPLVALNVFLDKFYSCYRDGLDGRKDMRSLVSMHFFLRLICNFLNVDQVLISVFFTVVIFLYTASSLLIALVRPYKKAYMNITDTLILTNLALISVVLNNYSGEKSHNSTVVVLYQIGGSILSTIPLLGLAGVVLYKVIKTLKHFCCSKLVHNQIEDVPSEVQVSVSQQVNIVSIDDRDLPDRMLHPEQYSLMGAYNLIQNKKTQKQYNF